MNITIRHLVGGFVGGFVGIALFHFFGFWAMFAGCSIGFITGFWAPEIYVDFQKPWPVFQKIHKYVRKQIRWHKIQWERLVAELQAWKKNTGSLWQKVFGYLGVFFLSMIPKAFGKSVRFCFSAPGKIIKWFKADPANRSWIATAIIVVSWASIAFYASWWYSQNYPVYRIDPRTKIVSNESTFWILIGIIAAIFGPLIRLGIDGENESNYEPRYKRWKEGSFKFSIIEFIKMAYAGIGLVILIVMGFASLILTFLCIMLAAAAVGLSACLVEILFNILKMSTRKVQWIGLSITLITTITIGLLTRNLFDNFIVWLVALGNGSLCGLLSAGAYHLVKYMFDNTNIARLKDKEPMELFDTIPIAVWNHIAKPTLITLIKPLQSV